MSKFTLPSTGTCKWALESNLIYGVPPFAVMEIDFKKGTGSCRWGKKTLGTISKIKVNKKRDEFSGNFAIKRRYRDQGVVNLTGKISADVENGRGGIDMTVSGMPDWRDNTNFGGALSTSRLITKPGGGTSFEVTLQTGGSGKAGGGATFGNLVVQDTDRRIEDTYPLVTAGLSYGIGLTVASSTTFDQIKLKRACKNWSGSLVELSAVGAALVIGYNRTKLTLTTPEGQKILLQSRGFGVSLEAKIDAGTQQIGSLGPRTKHCRF